MDFQTRYLRFFCSVAEERSFSKAAVKLCISQPALSQRIRDLEGQLGFPLFDRGARQISLTSQGEALLSSVRSLLGHVKQLEGEVLDLRRSARAPLLLGVAMYTDTEERAQLISRFLQAYPEEKIEMETGYTVGLFEGLLLNEFDFAIMTGPLADEQFQSLILRWYEPEVIVPAASPLARHDALRLEMLRGACIASFRRKRHPTLFDGLIGPFIAVGAAVEYAPDQTPGGALAFASENDMVVPAGFPMHSAEQVHRNNMVRRKVTDLSPIAALQLVRARGMSTRRRDALWEFAERLLATEK